LDKSISFDKQSLNRSRFDLAVFSPSPDPIEQLRQLRLREEEERREEEITQKRENLWTHLEEEKRTATVKLIQQTHKKSDQENKLHERKNSSSVTPTINK